MVMLFFLSLLKEVMLFHNVGSSLRPVVVDELQVFIKKKKYNVFGLSHFLKTCPLGL